MRSYVQAMAALAIVISGPAAASDSLPIAGQAQGPAAALAECVVAKSRGEDRITVARWLLAVMASAPQMTGTVKIDAGRKDQRRLCSRG